MIQIHGALSSRTFRCLWAAEEAGIDYEHVNVDFSRGEHLSEKFLAINPLGKVPALTEDGFCLFESGAICQYLAGRAPDRGLLPPDGTRERSLHDQWMFFVMSELEQPLWSVGKHTFALPAEYRLRKMLPVARFEYERPTAALSRALGDRSFLVDDRFTLADLCTVHTLKWGMNFKMAPTQENLLAYVQRHTERPAYRRVRDLARQARATPSD